ncbi:hypothetical protein [Catellatospora tritici]|uniref:hypothetical protein n=1 Tax=Catellatospora tritici TaxID=2851566 RepID=UPI001C2CED59|nr:hypothetical protein [Catellatospora tritici]MBV1853370.1 hypothetical protein [Catellatospora tritici]
MTSLRCLRVAPDGDSELWREVVALRRRVYASRLDLPLEVLEHEEEIDRHSFVFGLLAGGRLTATVRLTPATAPRLEMRDLGVLPAADDGAPEVCEVTRFAAEGGGRLYGAAVVHGFAVWMPRHTPVRRYYAYCRPAAVRHFALAFAARPVEGVSFGISERGVADYRVMVGTMADSAARTAHVRKHFVDFSILEPVR